MAWSPWPGWCSWSSADELKHLGQATTLRSAMASRHMCAVLSRGMASATQSVRPPVAVFGIEGRYATALYSAASKQKALDAVENDLKGFANQLQRDRRLKDFLLDPSVKKQLKVEGLSSACDKMKMSPLSKNLFVAMAENGRYTYLNSVINSFGTIMAAHRGEVVCEVTSAKPLDAAMTKEVENAIGAFLKSGEKSQISFKVDPAIIGGMVVSIGDKFVDMSMATKLKKYEDIIRSAV